MNLLSNISPDAANTTKDEANESVEDCRAIDSDQIIKVMYGTIQLLMQKVETLEAKLGA